MHTQMLVLIAISTEVFWITSRLGGMLNVSRLGADPYVLHLRAVERHFNKILHFCDCFEILPGLHEVEVDCWFKLQTPQTWRLQDTMSSRCHLFLFSGSLVWVVTNRPSQPAQVQSLPAALG